MRKTTEARWPLWDLPTRLGHALFIVALLLAWWSAETQRADLHQWVGYSLLITVLGRLVWGFIGSKPSRFATFLKGPGVVWRYLFSPAQNTRPPVNNQIIGHNPAGGWSVVVMLCLLLLQALSGLFNSDDILFSGPFYHLLESEWQDCFGVVHDYAFDALIVFIALHIAAVLIHCYRGENLVTPMILGSTDKRYSDQPPTTIWRWLITLLIIAATLWAAVQAAPQPSSQWF